MAFKLVDMDLKKLKKSAETSQMVSVPTQDASETMKDERYNIVSIYYDLQNKFTKGTQYQEGRKKLCIH